MNPAERGAYILVMRVDSSVRIRVGSLGLLSFTAGWYVYVGSALNGLSARVGRHLRLRKAIRWLDRNPILMEDFRLFLDRNGGSL